MAGAALATAQSYTVLHNFRGHEDGGVPYAGLTMDRAGHLFGTASQGGNGLGCQGGCGAVFELVRRNSAWLFIPLYAFNGNSDGAIPFSRVTIGPNGTLYGTTAYGGSSIGITGNGVVFNLQPPPHFSGNIFGGWNETVIHQFGQPPDGAQPYGEVAFDAQGNLYATTLGGGIVCASGYYCGIVFELTPQNDLWSESTLYTFTQQFLSIPRAGVVFDATGNLYSTLSNGNGAVFRLSNSGGAWTYTTLYQFMDSPDGSGAASGLIFDPSGNLFGTTVYGGANRQGTVYELMPVAGGWTESILYSLGGDGGSQPMAGVTRDPAGNLYGTTCHGGSHGGGAVFKLTPSGGGQWTETTLHNFGGSDGGCPHGDLLIDAGGNIYGTTSEGGPYGLGVIFEITP